MYSNELEMLRRELEDMKAEVERLKKDREEDEIRFRERVLKEDKKDIKKWSNYVNALKKRYEIKMKEFRGFRSKLQNRNGADLKESDEDDHDDGERAGIESRLKKLEDECVQSKKDFEELIQKALQENNKELKQQMQTLLKSK